MNKTKETSIQSINSAIETLEGKGIKITQLKISIETGLSIRTIKRYWKDIRVTALPVARVTGNKPASLNRVTLLGFDKFKRRANKSTMGISYVNPSEF